VLISTYEGCSRNRVGKTRCYADVNVHVNVNVNVPETGLMRAEGIA
jgi:hypothetical protein